MIVVGGIFRIYAARGHMSVDEHLYLFRHAEKIQRRIAVEVGGDLVDEAKQLCVPEDISGNLRPVFEYVKRLVKHPELIDEIGPDLQIFQQLHARIHLPLQIGDASISKYGHRARPAVKQLGQFDVDVDKYALDVLAVIFL